MDPKKQQMKDKFPVGSIVYVKGQIGPWTQIPGHMDYKVIGYHGNKLIVDDGNASSHWKQTLALHQASECMTVDEAKEEVAKLHAAQSIMDQEFEAVREEMSSKLDQAADLIQEAVEVAKAANKDIRSFKDAYRSVLIAIRNSGWTASDIKC